MRMHHFSLIVITILVLSHTVSNVYALKGAHPPYHSPCWTGNVVMENQTTHELFKEYVVDCPDPKQEEIRK